MAPEAPKSRNNIHYIPAEASFVDALAEGLVARGSPLPEMTVLLPNRRACRALQEAFLRRIGGDGDDIGAALLPNLQPIGELDEQDLMVLGPAILGEALEIPPALGPLRRRLMLARMILAKGAGGTDKPRLDQAIQLASALASLLDEVETEGLSLDSLDGLVVGDLARHWQVTVDFLDLLRRQWPLVLEAEGAIDPASRRNLLLDLQARIWSVSPPQGPVIAAGSTGSVPASARLMATIASLPNGMIVLPGLDMAPDAADWEAIERDPGHPQFALAQLLRRLGVARDAVALWPGVPSGRRVPERAWAVSMALLPAERTGRWPLLRGSEPASVAGWGNFARVDCRNEQEEALVIALALRRFLAEHKTGNAALVTPDRGLAQRVAGELGRWAIEIDDSAGKPLSRCPPGIFISTLASAAARQWSPVQLLCLLKHPMCAAGRSEGALRRWAGRMERALLRGPRPAAGWQGLEAALASISQRVGPETVEDIGRGLAELQRLSAPLADWQRDGSPRQRVVALTEVAEALAASDAQAGTERLYRGEDGEALALFLGEALQAFAGLPACDSETFEAMLQELLAGIDVRPRFGRHPRLFIWGPLEARLQQADLVILGGLNEGTWPAAGGDDPWMSRPMRAEFGLPALERRVGLAAHDFQQALGAAQVILTRSARVDGAPCVPSRWLMRLEALGATLDIGGLPGDSALVDLAGVLDDAGPPEPCARPAPAPGPAWRPILLSVTRIEAWRRDPYSIYASRILRLEKLDPLDQDPDAADLGTIIHRALDLHLARLVHAGPKNELQALLETGREAFGDFLLRPDVWAFWWPRFERIAAWFLDVERERRPSIARTMTEASARARVLDGPVPFDLTAKADRLDMMKDGRLAIIDYKTGAIPDDGDVRLGYSPQLALEAMLAIRGAFAGVPATASVAEIAHWRLKGGDIGGEIRRPRLGKAELDPMHLAGEAEAGLRRLLQYFDGPGATYAAVPDPRFQPRYNDYEHLERVLEWSGGGGE